MLSAAIAYQVLQQENPQTIDRVKAVLKNHPWYANQWQARLRFHYYHDLSTSSGAGGAIRKDAWRGSQQRAMIHFNPNVTASMRCDNFSNDLAF
jgi:hypothetical protein